MHCMRAECAPPPREERGPGSSRWNEAVMIKIGLFSCSAVTYATRRPPPQSAAAGDAMSAVRPALARTKRAGTSPMKQVVRESTMERQVHFPVERLEMDLRCVNGLCVQTSTQRSAGPFLTPALTRTCRVLNDAPSLT